MNVGDIEMDVVAYTTASKRASAKVTACAYN